MPGDFVYVDTIFARHMPTAKHSPAEELIHGNARCFRNQSIGACTGFFRLASHRDWSCK